MLHHSVRPYCRETGTSANDRNRRIKTIPGVKIVRLRCFQDARGQFMELFRKDWFPERSWDIVQSNRSDSAAGVLRGLHFHHQPGGLLACAPRRDSRRPGGPATFVTGFGNIEMIDLGQDEPAGLFIPIGVAHGFYAKTEATLTYIVDNYYDGQDELGIAWNDPELNIDWGVADAILSDRDRENPFLADIAREVLPR